LVGRISCFKIILKRGKKGPHTHTKEKNNWLTNILKGAIIKENGRKNVEEIDRVHELLKKIHPGYKNLGLDQQGELCVKILELSKNIKTYTREGKIDRN